MPASMSLPVCQCAHAAPRPASCPLGNARVPGPLASPWCRVRSIAAPAPCAAGRLPPRAGTGEAEARPAVWKRRYAADSGGTGRPRGAPPGARRNPPLCTPSLHSARLPACSAVHPCLPCCACFALPAGPARCYRQSKGKPYPKSRFCRCVWCTTRCCPRRQPASPASLSRSSGSSGSLVAAAAALRPHSLAASSGGMGAGARENS
jgi:hypothetical protein